MKVIILLGRQGSGKGTQAKLFVKEYDYSYIGSGDLLRAFSSGTGFSAHKTKEILNNGGYVPSVVIFRLWMDKLEALKDTNEPKGIVFDGSPRKLMEAPLLDQALEWYGWKDHIQVILLDISREEAVDRLTKRRICASCGRLIPWIGDYKNLKVCDVCGGRLTTREDDTPEAIKNRLDLFELETMPVIDYYKKDDRLLTINGEESIAKVYEDLKSKILSQNSERIPNT